MPQRTRGPLYLVPSVPQASTVSPEPSDADLVAAYLRDDGGGWAAEAIWRRHAPLVRRMVARAVGPGVVIEDLVQEAFLRLYRKLPGLRDAGALPAFVVTVTTRVIQTELRARWVRRWLGLSASGELPDSAGSGADLEARAALARFYRLLDGLRPKQRTVFVLRHVEGMELTEVAAATGVSLATVKRWLPLIAGRIQRQACGDPLLARYVTARPGAGEMEVGHD
jgi:RNA polymerase sigma-70 factor, ECF subfamily